MKKMIRIALLTVCLMLPAAPALAAPGDAILFQQTDNSTLSEVSGVQAEGDTFYLSVGQAFYTWRVGDAEPTLLMEGMPAYSLPNGEEGMNYSNFFVSDGVLYALNVDAGLLLKLSAQAGKTAVDQVIPLDFEDFIYTETYNGKEYTYVKQLSNWQCVDGRLFVTMEDWNEGDGEPQLFSFDLATGEKTAYESECITRFTGYQDGKLLCLVVDQENAYDSEAEKYKPLNLSIFDPEEDLLSPVAEIADVTTPYELYGMRYDAATDTLYFVCPERIYRMVQLGAPELCAYVPSSYFREYNGCIIALAGNHVMVNGETGVFVRNTDPQYLPKETLTIYGGYASDAHNKAIAQLDDTPVTFYDKSYFSTAQELGQALVSGENQIDLLQVSLSSIEFERLMEKGYCYDLSGNEKLKAFADSLYPFLQEGVTLDGKLFAIPIEMDVNCFGYTNSLKETGLAVPKTFLEICDFLTAWGEEGYYETFSDCMPYSQTNLKKTMAFRALDLYADYTTANNQPMTLDSALLRQLLTAVQALDLSDWEPQIDAETATDEDWNELYEKSELMMDYAQLEVRYEHEPWSIAAPIQLTEETPLCIGADVTVFFINPRSQHIDAALRYLAAYTDAISALEKAGMCPALNEPIENESYQRNLESYTKQLETAKKSLETAKEADKAALEEQVQNIKEWRDEYEKGYRYSATAESIAAYRALDSYFFLKRPNPLYTHGSEELTSLYARYIDGQITLDQFISEGDAKLRLMQLENQ